MPRRKTILMSFLFTIALVFVAFAASACTGAVGLQGEQGLAGTAGADGADGADGIDWPGPVPAAYEAADGIAGGAAYAKWWVTDADGSGTQPTTTVSSDFYRCKSCHGWDGLGNDGSYANRTGQSTGKTTRPDVSSVNLRSTALSESHMELYDLIAHPAGRALDAADNTHPDYSTLLTADQTWNLVKFMREEWVEPTDLYDLEVTGAAMNWDYTGGVATLSSPTLTYTNIGKDGDATNGDAIYAAKCASCHGTDGKTITDVDGYPSVGAFLRAKPHEAWFKIKFGEPGAMPTGMVTSTSDLQDLYKALTNSTNYPD